MKFNPPDYFWIYIIAELIIHIFYPGMKIIHGFWNYLGFFLIAFGIYLNWIHVYKLFNLANTHFDVFKKPNKLVVNGFFRYSRNPTYFGMLLTFIGLAIILGSLTTFVIPIIFFILVNTYTIPIEEAHLNSKFGKKYAAYKNQVRRWI